MSSQPADPSSGIGGLRAIATSYRTRVLVAILLVVTVTLLLVLFSLPRLLDGYFVQQERDNLQSRAQTLATLIGSELARAASEGPTHPILVGGAGTFTTGLTLQEGYVQGLTEDIALADVTVQIAPAPGEPAVFVLLVTLPDESGTDGRRREPITATATESVRDVFWSISPETAPIREISVILSNPFTFREQTTQTITDVLITAALIALVVALITALLLAQWLAQPLRRLTRTTRLLADGHLDARVEMPANSAPEVQELSSAFNEMAARLQRSVAIISEDRDRGREFLADVSHELRTPIAALRTFNELLIEGAAEDPDTRGEFLRQSRQQVERLDWLAANLLELSKLDSSLVSLALREGDLRSVADDAVEAAESVAERKGVNIRADVPDEPIIQPYDPPRLGQVLANLIGNAVKFTPSGGHVTVSVRSTDDGARFEVSDDGVGIDQDELEHIFDRFYRGTRTPQERAGGSGLGLAIVRSIVDMHGGRVSVTSTPDVGTNVMVDLPCDMSLSSSATPPT